MGGHLLTPVAITSATAPAEVTIKANALRKNDLCLNSATTGNRSMIVAPTITAEKRAKDESI
jgi:hypothetical protein